MDASLDGAGSNLDLREKGGATMELNFYIGEDSEKSSKFLSKTTRCL